MWFHDQGVLLQVNTGITLQMTSWHNTDIHTNTVRTNFNHFSTLPQNLVLLWLILFEKYFFKHSNPVSSVVSEIKSGVRGSYAAEKVGTLKVKKEKSFHLRMARLQFNPRFLSGDFSGSSRTIDFKIGTWRLPYRLPGIIIGSTLGLVGWVRWKVWSATSASVW